jgi:hypothetical protein
LPPAFYFRHTAGLEIDLATSSPLTDNAALEDPVAATDTLSPGGRLAGQ